MTTMITLNNSNSNSNINNGGGRDLNVSGGSNHHLINSIVYKNADTHTSSNSLYSKGDEEDDDDSFYDCDTNPSWLTLSASSSNSQSTTPVQPSYLINDKSSVNNNNNNNINNNNNNNNTTTTNNTVNNNNNNNNNNISTSQNSTSSLLTDSCSLSSPIDSPINSPTLIRSTSATSLPTQFAPISISSSQLSQSDTSAFTPPQQHLANSNNSNNNSTSASTSTSSSNNGSVRSKRNSRVINLIKSKKDELSNLFKSDKHSEGDHKHDDEQLQQQQPPQLEKQQSQQNISSSNLNEQVQKDGQQKDGIRKLIKRKLIPGHHNISSNNLVDEAVSEINKSSDSSMVDKQQSQSQSPHESRVTRWLKNHNSKKKKDIGNSNKYVLGQSIQGHKGSIWSLEISRDENLIATAGSEGIIKIWKVLKSPNNNGANNIPSPTTTTCANNSIGNGSGSNNSSDDESICSNNSNTSSGGSSNNNNNTVTHNHQILEYPPKTILEGHTNHILEMKWVSSKYLISSSVDKTVKLWNVETGECIKTYEHNDIVVSITFDTSTTGINSSSDGNENIFYSATLDGVIRKWSINGDTTKPLLSLEMNEYITTIVLSHDPYYLIVSTHLGNLYFYSPVDLSLIHRFNISASSNKTKKGKGPKIVGIQIISNSLNQNEILVSSNDSCIRHFSLKDFKRICRYGGGILGNYQVKPTQSLDKKSIIMGCEDNLIYIWDNFSEHLNSSGGNLVSNSNGSNNIDNGGNGHNKISIENYEYFAASNKPITNTTFLSVNNNIFLITTDTLGHLLVYNKY